MIMEKVLIVGGGVTGAIVSSFLRNEFGPRTIIYLWDKGSQPGGRMYTNRSRENNSCTVDLGAQYISATHEYAEKHSLYYDELLTCGVLKPLVGKIDGDMSPPDTKHYITPTGISSLVKHYLSKSGVNERYKTMVKSIDVDKISEKVTVATTDDEQATFDGVVITMPVPQILQLQGSVAEILDKTNSLKTKLQTVSYSSRYALGLFFEKGQSFDVPWSAKYITENPVIRFISIDNKKRNVDNEESIPSVCIHTSVPFGLKHLDDDKEEVEKIIYQQYRELFPQFPDSCSMKCNRWRYSQVFKSFEGQPGCVVLHEKPLIILAGDAFTHSNYDGCLESALSVLKVFQGQSR